MYGGAANNIYLLSDKTVPTNERLLVLVAIYMLLAFWQ